ncbi:S-adenosyl-L-methionine-dependent methyltransferase [Coniochaeta sp. 2T2.1]|nr:S-adenosyl-L-methionine-dependent methyltransferase [Coniochaeta sp. 2T2.1]
MAQQNGQATDASEVGAQAQAQARDGISFEEHVASPISNGASSPSSNANGNKQHVVATYASPVDDDSMLEADDTSVEGDVSPNGLGADVASGLEFEHPGAHGGSSVYAFSTYPRTQPAFQVEHPFDTMPDSATIDSARTIYADDIDYTIEHGRRYCGDYSMPNDVTEQTRQYVIHQVYLKLFNLELTTVPLADPTCILDIGTGIGEWAIGMAERYPEADVFGTDIAAIQPTDQVPFNVEFHIEDAEEEWIRPPDAVDLVHVRNMAGAFRDWGFIYSQAFACIKPGVGWIEVLDFDDHRGYKNFLSWFPQDSAVHVMINALRQASEMDGRPKGVAHMDKGMLARAGFVDITEMQHDIPLGRRENAKFGEDWLFACVTGLEATCLRLLTKYMGWEAEYVRGLCDEVARETKKLAEDPNRAKGFVVKLRVLVGRKPEVPGRGTAKTSPRAENGVVREEVSEDGSTIGTGDGREGGRAVE